MDSSNSDQNDLVERQQQDPELGVFVKLRKTRRDLPEWDELQAESELTKKLVSRWDQFEVHNDLVYRRYRNTPGLKGTIRNSW